MSVLALATAGVATAAASGCYERVVRSKGFGASTTQVYDENANLPSKKSKTALDRKPKYNY